MAKKKTAMTKETLLNIPTLRTKISSALAATSVGVYSLFLLYIIIGLNSHFFRKTNDSLNTKIRIPYCTKHSWIFQGNVKENEDLPKTNEGEFHPSSYRNQRVRSLKGVGGLALGWFDDRNLYKDLPLAPSRWEDRLHDLAQECLGTFHKHFENSRSPLMTCLP